MTWCTCSLQPPKKTYNNVFFTLEINVKLVYNLMFKTCCTIIKIKINVECWLFEYHNSQFLRN